MKKQSATKPSLKLHELTFFTDRDLGNAVARILREHGLRVEVYFDHFKDNRVADNHWLGVVARKQWVALSHDDNIRRDSEAVRTIMQNSGRLIIIRGHVPLKELATFFIEAQESTEKILTENPAPLIANVRRVAHKAA